MEDEKEGSGEFSDYLGIRPASALDGVTPKQESVSQAEATGQATGIAGLSSEQARIHIDSILSDKNHPYHDASGRPNPAHGESVAYVKSLYERAYPGGVGETGLAQAIKRAGLESAEQIEREAKEGRQALTDAQVEKEYGQAMAQLKIDLGTDEVESAIERTRYVLDKVFSKEDANYIIGKFSNDALFVEWINSGIENFFPDVIERAKNYKREGETK